jgi:hypothetical protein
MPDGKWMSVDEAVEQLMRRAEMFADDPASVYLTLGEIVRTLGISADEILGELSSGRLKAFALHETVMVRAEMGFSGDEFGVSGLDLAKWLDNPQTPPHITARLRGDKAH